jgi:isopentenyl-diphosphate delta-isomerase type 1
MPSAIEMIDVVDEDGVPTGHAEPRTLIHRRGDWHRTVHIWIENNRGEVLFQKRSPSKESFPGAWDVSAAGHIESGETSVAAAIKEVREELGIDVLARDLRLLFTVKGASVQNRGTFIDNEISDVYVIRLDIDIREIHPQESEVSGVRFVPLAELARLAHHRDKAFVPHGREYRRLHEYLQTQKK